MRSLKDLAEQPRLSPIETLALPSYLILGIAWGLLCAGLALTSFSYDGSMNLTLSELAIILVSSMGMRYLSFPRLAGTMEAIALKLGISSAAALGSVMLAATAMPLVDDRLIRWDSLIGFDWLAFMRWLSDKPNLIAVLNATYPTLNFQLFVLVPALFLARQETRCWTMILAWGLTLTCTMILFPLFPAVGPIVHYNIGLPGIPMEMQHMDVFMGARDGTVRQLGIDTLRGMVTFPSFHIAAALVMGWAAAGLRYLKWPFIGLNAAMFVSAIPIGGHYLVDLIAGAAIAVAAIFAARHILDRQSKVRPSEAAIAAAPSAEATA